MIEDIYYELALILNKELYDEEIISHILYQKTEKEILKRLKS